MRRAVFFLLVLFAVPSFLFAQSGDPESWRDRPARDRDRYDRRGGDNAFELTPFGGYRYGGTLYASESDLFNYDADIASSANFGVNFGIPIVDNGMKLELMVNRQDTHFKAGSGLFEPNLNLGDVAITYYHGGLMIPFGDPRNVTPFVVVSAGVANLDPDIAGVSAENRFSASAGIGVKVPINRNLAFRVEARGYYTSVSDNECSRCYYDSNRDLYQGETNVGLSLRF
jgi:hypothetical protein